MNVLKYRVSLDMFDTLSQITIKAKKGDSACQIHITLTEKGKIYHIGEGCYATFNAKKSDGNFIFDKCTIEDNSIVYDFSSSIDEDGNAQISACEGIAECEVTLYNAESHQLTSPRFTLFIDGTVYNGEEIISTPQANVLKELINEANSLIDEVETKLDNFEVDQTYNPKSENAQSGKAVAEAVEPYEYLKKDDNGYTNIDLLSSKHLEVAENYVAVLPTADRFLSEVPVFLNKGVNIIGETFVETEPTTEHSIATKGYVDGLIGDIETTLDNFEVDQTYKPTSKNAQSGMAVAEAVAPKADKSYLDNTFANALKGSKSGSAVVINDISPVEHNLDVKLTSDTITDFSNVEIKKYGKNLFDTLNAEIQNGYSQIVERTEKSITLSQDLKATYVGKAFTLPDWIGGKTLTVSAKVKTSGANQGGFRICRTDNNGIPQGAYCFGTISTNGDEVTLSKTSLIPKLESGYKCYTLWMYSNTEGSLEAGVTYTTTLSDIQIEISNTATEYEPYLEPQTVTASADGTVEGIKSISPNITLVTDTDDVIINCEYNRDINKAFAELQQAILNNS